MSTTIQTQCAEALQRFGIIPSETAQERMHRFAQSLDQRIGQLEYLDQFELENDAVEYVTAWATAEMLESAVRETGPVALRYAKDSLEKSCRVNPALTHAAAARTRMRQIYKTIKSLLKPAPKDSGERAENGESTRARENEHTSAQASACPPTERTRASEGERTREPEPLDYPTPPPTTTATPETPETPAAPPMNRAQRRAQARFEAKQRRKAQKWLHREGRNPDKLAAPDHESAST